MSSDSPESGRMQTPNQQGQMLSPEALANSRFITLFQKIIDECEKVEDGVSDGGYVAVAVLNRMPGWEPVKPIDVNNAMHRIFVTEASEFNSRDVTVTDLDPEDSSTYYSKRFYIVEDTVGVEISHMRVSPNNDEPRDISYQTHEQAPVEMLTPVLDEIESILDRQAVV